MWLLDINAKTSRLLENSNARWGYSDKCSFDYYYVDALVPFIVSKGCG